MKKIISAFFGILILIMSAIPVMAAQKEYRLDDLGLSVSIPKKYDVVTRATSADSAIFKKWGKSKTEVISQFEASSIYLNAVSSYNEEIVVTMMENSMDNLSLFSDTALKTIASGLVNEYSNYGFNVSKYEIYHHSQAKFIKIYFTDSAKTVHGLQYYTIYDGKAMNFTMRSYTGGLSSQQKSTIKKVVDSIKYDSEPPKSKETEETEAFLYTDKDTNTTYTVPANWKQEPFYETREYSDVKFVSVKEQGCIIVYGSTDMWEEMPDTDKIGYTRADLNNSLFTETDIAEMYGTTMDKVSFVEYNGIRYYKVEITSTQEAYGLDFSITTTQLVYIHNGWMYTFQFMGTSDHKLYSDFEKLLNSVKYPSVSDTSDYDYDNSTSFETDNSKENSDVITSVILLMVVAGIFVAIIIYRKRKNKDDDLSDCDLTVLESKGYYEQNTFCRNCGQELPSDSEYCHICGTKISDVEK